MPVEIFYHGSPRRIAKFDLANLGTGSGADQEGPGIYLTSDPDDAKKYAWPNGFVHKVEVTGRKWLKDGKRTTERNVRILIRKAPDLADTLTNWDENPVVAFENAVAQIMDGYGDNQKEAYEQVWADFYAGSPGGSAAYLQRLVRWGYVGVKPHAASSNPVKHVVVFNPAAIKILDVKPLRETFQIGNLNEGVAEDLLSVIRSAGKGEHKLGELVQVDKLNGLRVVDVKGAAKKLRDKGIIDFDGKNTVALKSMGTDWYWQEVKARVAPPGFSGTVAAMIDKHPDKFKVGAKRYKRSGQVMDPYEIAWSLFGKGAKSGYGTTGTVKGLRKYVTPAKYAKLRAKGKAVVESAIYQIGKSVDEAAIGRELYHSTSLRGVAKILKSRELKAKNGDGYVSFSDKPLYTGDISAVDAVIVFDAGKLRSQVDKVEYDEEWYDANRDRAAYIAGEGWREQFVIDDSDYSDFDSDDPDWEPNGEETEEFERSAEIEAFTAKSREREWVSKSNNVVIPNGAVLRVLVPNRDTAEKLQKELNGVKVAVFKESHQIGKHEPLDETIRLIREELNPQDQVLHWGVTGWFDIYSKAARPREMMVQPYPKYYSTVIPAEKADPRVTDSAWDANGVCRRAASTATQKLTALGAKRMRQAVLYTDYSAEVNANTGGAGDVGGYAFRKKHGIGLDTKHALGNFSYHVSIYIHEWAHHWFFTQPKSTKKLFEDYYKNVVLRAASSAEMVEKKNIDKAREFIANRVTNAYWEAVCSRAVGYYSMYSTERTAIAALALAATADRLASSEGAYLTLAASMWSSVEVKVANLAERYPETAGAMSAYLSLSKPGLLPKSAGKAYKLTYRNDDGQQTLKLSFKDVLSGLEDATFEAANEVRIAGKPVPKRSDVRAAVAYMKSPESLRTIYRREVEAAAQNPWYSVDIGGMPYESFIEEPELIDRVATAVARIWSGEPDASDGEFVYGFSDDNDSLKDPFEAARLYFKLPIVRQVSIRKRANLSGATTLSGPQFNDLRTFVELKGLTASNYGASNVDELFATTVEYAAMRGKAAVPKSLWKMLVNVFSGAVTAERVDEGKRETIDGIAFLRNPSRSELLGLCRTAARSYGASVEMVRGIADGDDYVWWEGYDGTHAEAAKALGLGDTKTWYASRLVVAPAGYTEADPETGQPGETHLDNDDLPEAFTVYATDWPQTGFKHPKVVSLRLKPSDAVGGDAMTLESIDEGKKDVNGVEYYENPSAPVIAALARRYTEIRGWFDADGTVYVWPASEMTHFQFAAEVLGLRDTSQYYAYLRKIKYDPAVQIDQDGFAASAEFKSRWAAKIRLIEKYLGIAESFQIGNLTERSGIKNSMLAYKAWEKLKADWLYKFDYRTTPVGMNRNGVLVLDDYSIRVQLKPNSLPGQGDRQLYVIISMTEDKTYYERLTEYTGQITMAAEGTPGSRQSDRLHKTLLGDKSAQSFYHEYRHFMQDTLTGGKALSTKDAGVSPNHPGRYDLETADKIYYNQPFEIDARYQARLSAYVRQIMQNKFWQEGATKEKRVEAFESRFGKSAAEYVANEWAAMRYASARVTPETRKRTSKRMSGDYAKLRQLAVSSDGKNFAKAMKLTT